MAIIRAGWRILMVVKDALVLLLLLGFFALVYAALSAVRPAPTASRGALLIALDGSVVEQPATSDPLVALQGGGDVHEYRLRDVVHAIETAATDANVRAIVLDLSRFTGAGQSSAQRIGRALDGARRAGKPVFAYALQYDDSGYAIAAHASEIWLEPLGLVALTGPGGSQLYYKGLIDKLGITTHIYRVGTYKSFVEPFIRTDQSEPARQANKALVDALWADWTANVRAARPKAPVLDYANNPMVVATRFGGDTGAAAKQLGLVDVLGDSHAFAARVAKIAGADPSGNPAAFATLRLDDYLRRHPVSERQGKVGVVTVAGDIMDGEAGPGTAGADSIAHLIDDALAQGTIKALVVRVDSPGGSVTGAETIRKAVLAARDKGLPIVVSMGDVAASGGYWISTAGQKILAQPSTITGSIGVFGIVPSFEQTLAKIGITTDGVRTTPLSGEPDVVGGVSPEFNALAQASVENIYKRFVGLVANSRRISPDDAEKLAEGRVWDGASAQRLHLIDGYGTLDDAVAEAARMASLSGGDAAPRYLDPPLDPFERLMSLASARVQADRRPAAMDWLTAQSRAHAAAARDAVAQARSLLDGPAVRIDCLECRAYGRTRPAVSATAVSPALWERLWLWLTR